MGMFDELRCEAPLPDGLDARELVFQTKSLPYPCLDHYVIHADGRLRDSARRDCEPDGYVNFYTQRPDADGQKGIWREYRARFREGQLAEITVVDAVEKERMRYRHSGLTSFRWFAPAGTTSE